MILTSLLDEKHVYLKGILTPQADVIGSHSENRLKELARASTESQFNRILQNCSLAPHSGNQSRCLASNFPRNASEVGQAIQYGTRRAQGRVRLESIIFDEYHRPLK